MSDNQSNKPDLEPTQEPTENQVLAYPVLDEGVWVLNTQETKNLKPTIEPADKQFLTYAIREADAATADYQQSKLVFENAAENYQAKVSGVRGFLEYLTKKYSLDETQDIDEQGNIITRSQ